MNIQLKPGDYLNKQQALPVPRNPPGDAGRELESLIRSGHLNDTNDVDKDRSVSPVVIIEESNQLLKIALHSPMLNDNCIKKSPQISNMEKLSNQISVETTGNRTVHLFNSKFELGFAYRQRKLFE